MGWIRCSRILLVECYAAIGAVKAAAAPPRVAAMTCLKNAISSSAWTSKVNDERQQGRAVVHRTGTLGPGPAGVHPLKVLLILLDANAGTALPLICMLACYLTWHLRCAWAPLTFTDENPPAQENPVAPARRSADALAKASCQHDPAGRPYRSFRGLLDHLATLARNQVRFAGTRTTVAMLTEPTSAQRQAFDLIGSPVPLTLT